MQGENTLKAKINDSIQTLVTVKGYTYHGTIPKGTKGTIIECYTTPHEGYAVDVFIPDQSQISGFAYDNIILSPDQFEITNESENDKTSR